MGGILEPISIWWQAAGLIGMVSLLAWIVAAVIVIVGLPMHRRGGPYVVALGLAVVSAVTSWFASSTVNAIQVDRSEQEQRIAEIAEAELEDKASQRRLAFAEDTQVEQLAIEADIGQASLTEAQRRALREKTREAVPAWKARGKQQRDEAAIEEGTAADAFVDEQEQQQAAVVKMLPRPLAIADGIDKVNLVMAEVVLVIVLLALIWHYLRRFNRVFDPVLPLPVGGRWLDGLMGRSHVAWLASDKPDKLHRLLKSLAAKDETIVDIAAKPLPWMHNLSRWLGIATPRRTLEYHEPQALHGEFNFESAWFGRYHLELVGEATARAYIEQILPQLARRERSRASAMTAVNLVWRLPASALPTDIDRFVEQCERTNHRLIIVASEPPPLAWQPYVQEFADDSGIRQPASRQRPTSAPPPESPSPAAA